MRPWICVTRSFRGEGEDHKGPNPLTASRVAPILPEASESERLVIFHRNGKGLPCPCPFERSPFVKAIDWNEAAGTSTRRNEVPHRACLIAALTSLQQGQPSRE
jgi:hypothetical protein